MNYPQYSSILLYINTSLHVYLNNQVLGDVQKFSLQDLAVLAVCDF